MRHPNFFIVGAVKSGTSSMHAYLERHPQVFMSGLKEPHWFGPADRRAVRTEAEYLALFREATAAHRIVGEASTSYLWDVGAAARIRAFAPEARILILLRDPVERAHAHYLMHHTAGLQRESFLAALAAEARLPAGTRGDRFHRYIEVGRYAGQVARYFDLFGRDPVLVAEFADMRRDAAAVVAQVLGFLRIDAAPAARIVEAEGPRNQYRGPGNWMAFLLMGTPGLRRAGRLLPGALRRHIKTNLLFTRTEKPEIDPRARAMLADIYAPEVAALEELLGRPLPGLRAGWGGEGRA